MACSLPGYSCGIFQARVLEWVAISFSRGFSPLRDPIWVSCIVGRGFTIWATREVRMEHKFYFFSVWWLTKRIQMYLVSFCLDLIASVLSPSANWFAHQFQVLKLTAHFKKPYLGNTDCLPGIVLLTQCVSFFTFYSVVSLVEFVFISVWSWISLYFLFMVLSHRLQTLYLCYRK